MKETEKSASEKIENGPTEASNRYIEGTRDGISLLWNIGIAALGGLNTAVFYSQGAPEAVSILSGIGTAGFALKAVGKGIGIARKSRSQ